MILEVNTKYTQEYIANVFWSLEIAKVSSVTLIPFLYESYIFNIAYIKIDEWFDSEFVYELIQKFKTGEKVKIMNNKKYNEWWPVEINTHNDGDISVGAYTVTFDSSYFKKKEFEDDDETAPCTEIDDDETAPCTEVDDEDCFNERPIKGLGNDYYSVTEALNLLWDLQQKRKKLYDTIKSQRDEQFMNIEDEINHFENELRIHESILNSSNVTLRAAQAELFPSEWRRDTVFYRKIK